MHMQSKTENTICIYIYYVYTHMHTGQILLAFLFGAWDRKPALRSASYLALTPPFMGQT